MSRYNRQEAELVLRAAAMRLGRNPDQINKQQIRDFMANTAQANISQAAVLTAAFLGVMNESITGGERVYNQINIGNLIMAPDMNSTLGGPNFAGKAGVGVDSDNIDNGSLYGDAYGLEAIADARLIQYGSIPELQQRLQENATQPNPNIPQPQKSMAPTIKPPTATTPQLRPYGISAN